MSLCALQADDRFADWWHRISAVAGQTQQKQVNSVLYYGTSASNLHKRQLVQNALARTITRSPRSVPTSQLLSNLHWAPYPKFQSRHPNVQGPFYSTTCLSLQPHILPSTQSFAAFLQSVSPPSSQGKNRFQTSCFFLCCSSNLESYTCRH